MKGGSHFEFEFRLNVEAESRAHIETKFIGSGFREVNAWTSFHVTSEI